MYIRIAPSEPPGDYMYVLGVQLKRGLGVPINFPPANFLFSCGELYTNIYTNLVNTLIYEIKYPYVYSNSQSSVSFTSRTRLDQKQHIQFIVLQHCNCSVYFMQAKLNHSIRILILYK